jgi:hypothetical protein
VARSRRAVMSEVRSLRLTPAVAVGAPPATPSRGGFLGRLGGHMRQNSWVMQRGNTDGGGSGAQGGGNTEGRPAADGREGGRSRAGGNTEGGATDEPPTPAGGIPAGGGRRSRRGGGGGTGATPSGPMAALLRGGSLANIGGGGSCRDVAVGLSPPPTPSGAESEEKAAAAMLAHRCHTLRYKSNRVPAWCDRILCAALLPLAPLFCFIVAAILVFFLRLCWPIGATR